MADTAIAAGHGRSLLASASRTPGTYNSDDWVLLDGGGGLIVTLEVTDVGSSGSVDTLSLQAKSGANYDTVVTFGTLAITGTGRYRFQVVPGAAAAGSYKGSSQSALPYQGRVQVVHTTGTMIYTVRAEAVRP